jgi:eukaryotic-like serine/threonine-protein kinase
MSSAALTCQECGQPLPDADAACPACLFTLGVSTERSDPITATASFDEAEGQVIGRYKLLEVIGEGGFGTVWMAQQEEPLRRRVALKILKAGMDTRQVVMRFEAERQALAMMDHTSIARVFDGGATDTGRPYFVMELVRGVPITEFCDARKLTTNQRVALFIPVCQAIQHAHQKGVIHRDLKPSNILVTDEDGEPLPKVVDFGIAKATDTPLTEKTVFTRFNQIIGTPAYMSPEQAGLGGLDVDSRTDVYSLGVLLYELLTGAPPFDACKLPDVLLRAIREAEPPKPSTRLSTLSREELAVVAARRKEPLDQLNRTVKGDLDWIILKALEKDRNRRYETASAFASDLNRFLQGEPVTAAPPSVAYQLTKFAKKHRHVLATLFAFVFILITGIVATTTQAVRATRLAKSETAQRAMADRLRAEQRELLYASQMAVCSRALDFGQVQKARQILEEQRPGLGLPDLRGWEWRHFWAMTRPMELDVLERQPSYVSAIAYSSDGRLLALGYGGDGGIRLYDAKDNRLLADERIGLGTIGTLAFTPSGDGLYAGLRSTNFVLLDSATLNIQHHFVGHRQPIAAVIPDITGDILVSAAGNFYAQEAEAETFIWNARERKILFKLSLGPGTAILPRLSASGRYLSRGLNQGGMVEVWDLRERRKLVEFKAHQNFTHATAFSPDETMLATTGDNGFVRLWNWRKRQEIATLGRHTAPGSDIVFSPNGRRIVTSSLDSTVRIWDVAEQREQAVLLGHRGGIHRVAFSPDGSRIASAGGADYSVRFWSAESRGPAGKATLLDAATPSSATAQFTPDGQEYCLLRVTPEGSSSLKVWRTEPSRDGSYELLSSFRSPETLAMTLSGTNLVLLVAGKSEIVVQELISGRELQRMKSPVPLLGPVTASRDGRWLAAFAMTNHVVVWDAQTGMPAAVFQLPNTAGATRITGRRALLLSPDGTKLWVVFPGAANVVCVDWKALNVLISLEGHTRAVLALASSPDGTIIATGSADMTARLWDAATGAHIAVLHGENGGVTVLSFSPDGLTLATGYFDGPIKLWSVRAKTELAPFYAHNSIVHSILFSPEPDARTLASVGEDGTARVWRAPSLEQIDLAIRTRPPL